MHESYTCPQAVAPLPARQPQQSSRSGVTRMRIAALVLSLFVILGAAIWWAVGLWMSVEGPPMPATGYVAMWLGIVFSLVIGCGLMALMFYSSRCGYDE